MNCTTNTQNTFIWKFEYCYKHCFWKSVQSKIECLVKTRNYKETKGHGKLLNGSTQAPVNIANDIVYGVDAIADGSKYATSVPWGMAIWGGTRASFLLKIDAKKRGIRQRMRCYVGKDLLSQGASYVTFLPPHNNQVRWVYGALTEFGIAQRRSQEGMTVLHSKRM